MLKNIGYQTRSDVDDTKIVGGSFGGSIDLETVNRLVKSRFEVHVTHTGRGVFVDKSGRHVRLYLSVDPLTTDKGQVALKVYNKELEARQRIEDEKQKEVDDLLSNYTADELLVLLKPRSIRQ